MAVRAHRERSHPRRSLEIMPRSVSPPRPRARGCRHHERFDGTGFPDGVEGEALPSAPAASHSPIHQALASARRRERRTESALTQISELGQSPMRSRPGMQTAFVRWLRQRAPGQKMSRRS